MVLYKSIYYLLFIISTQDQRTTDEHLVKGEK